MNLNITGRNFEKQTIAHNNEMKNRGVSVL